MTTFTDAAHNLLWRLDADAWAHDLRLSGVADLVGYSEAEGDGQRKALASYCRAQGRGLYHPQGSGNPVSWKRDVWRALPQERGVVEVHAKHPTAKYNPARDVVWVGLRHKATGARVLRINVHPVAGATKPEGDTPWGDGLDAWKDWAIRQYYLAVVAFTAQQLARETWDAVLLGGDFNGRLENQQEWYYPGPLLLGLFERDAAPRSIDRLVWTRSSNVRQVRRWSQHKGVRSDHALQFAEYRLLP